MSLVFCDGCDHYTSVQGISKWDVFSCNNIPNGGRFGAGSIQSGPGVGQSAWVATKFVPTTTTIIMGVAVKLQSGTYGTGVSHFRVIDGTTVQCEIRFGSLGQISIYTNNVLQGSSVNGLIVIGFWNFIEWKVTITASTGANQCVVRLNNAEVLNLVGVSTKTTANSSVNSISIGRNSTDSTETRFDDLYVCNNQGTINNDFLGDCRIETLYPNAPGNNTTFAPNGAPTNWQAVSEATPDDDVSYVLSDVPGNMDSYMFTNPTGTLVQVFGIQAMMRARKDNAGTRTFARIVRVGGTDYAGSPYLLGTDYTYYRDIMEINPGTGVPWNASDIAALEAGVKVVS